MNKFDQELIDAIADESNKFDMSIFASGGTGLPSCETARCMAGHICGTLRPNLSAALLKAFPERFLDQENGQRPVNYRELAQFIYTAETGKPCLLDFYGEAHESRRNLSTWRSLSSFTRAETIAHIRGRSKRWPRLTSPTTR